MPLGEDGSPRDQFPSISKNVVWRLSPTSSMSCARNDFWLSTRRVPSGCLAPNKYGTRGCMPLLVKSVVGSFSGTRLAEGISVCPRLIKKDIYLLRTTLDFILCIISLRSRKRETPWSVLLSKNDKAIPTLYNSSQEVEINSMGQAIHTWVHRHVF